VPYLEECSGPGRLLVDVPHALAGGRGKCSSCNHGGQPVAQTLNSRETELQQQVMARLHSIKRADRAGEKAVDQELLDSSGAFYLLRDFTSSQAPKIVGECGRPLACT